MSRRTRWILALVVLLALGALLARGLANRKPGSAGAAKAAASAPMPAVELAATDLARARHSELTQTLAVSGGLKAVQSAFVKARVAAEVKSLAVREGDRVAAGQLIGQLDTTEYDWRLRQALDQAQSAEAQLEIAERTLANNQALVNQGFISRNALDTSVSNAAAARAALQAARAAAEIARKAVKDGEVRAPIAGLVSQRLVQPGERVAVDTRLVEIVDLSRIELEAAVAPEDVPSVRVGQAARVAIDGLAEPVAARVVRINPSATAGTRTVMAYLLLDSHPALRQGLFGRATVELQRRTALVIPASALRFDQSRPYVVVAQQGLAVERVVTVGQRGDATFGAGARPEPAVEITTGLEPGSIVLRGTVGSLRGGTRLALPDVAQGSAPAAVAADAVAPAAAAAPATRPVAAAASR
ncbi:MAG: efflux RND transporter periplasmic adaptor subunit [Burkholderiales bacterium]|nr:efflux RND transporter periplasmic adaptor subunit [Burkholderiales bacterium]